MLLRWLILQLCATRSEIRLVLRALRTRYRLQTECGEPRRTLQGVLQDKHLARNWRLALLVGLLAVHAENPRLVAGALVAIPLALVLLVLRLIGLLP